MPVYFEHWPPMKLVVADAICAIPVPNGFVVSTRSFIANTDIQWFIAEADRHSFPRQFQLTTESLLPDVGRVCMRRWNTIFNFVFFFFLRLALEAEIGIFFGKTGGWIL